MATSSPLGTKSPQDSDNPGAEEFDMLIEHNYSPEERDRLSQIANGSPSENNGYAEAAGQPSREGLSDTENSAGGEAVSHTYRPTGSHQPRRSSLFGFIMGHPRRSIVSGAVLAILISAILVFLSVLPFKILHIMNNLQSHFFSTSENALSNETDTLLSHYVKKYVLPGLNTCASGRTIDKSCTPKAIQGNSIVSNLYKGWRRGRVENLMATKYGIEFAKVGKRYYIKTPQLTGKGVQLDSNFVNPESNETLNDFFNKSNDSQIKRVGRSELRAAVNDALDGETFYKKTWYRFKVGRLLEEKYGIKRCIVACTARDNFADWKDNKKLAAKAYMVDRIITPRSEALSIVLKCLLAGTGGDTGVCSYKTTQLATSCEGTCELNDAPESQWEADLRSQLASYAQTLGSEKAQALIDEVNAIRDKGYAPYLFEKVFGGIESPDGKNVAGDITEKSGESAAAQAEFAAKLAELGKNANIISAINTAANLIHSLGGAGPLLHKLTYVTNAGTMVSAFAMYRTYADEIKTGNVDSTIVGSFTNSLNPGPQDTQDSHTQTGGDAGAEQAPLYSNLINDSSKSSSATISLVNSLLPAKALAATPSYTCNDGNPLSAGKLVCPEENLNTNSIADDFQGAFRTEPLSTIKTIVDKFERIKGGLFGPFFKAVNWALGQLTSFISSIASLIPGVSDLESLATQLLDKLTGFLISQVIPSPVSSNNSGGRMFDLVAGGADVSANDAAHHGLGGQALSPSQQAAILNDQQQLDNAQYHSQSVIARLFDTNSDNSLITRLAMAMPANFDNSRASLANLFTNPFKNVSSALHPVYAAGSAADPFGVTQYGYTENDPIFQQDPDQYWSQHCVDSGQEGNPQVSLATNKETYQWDASATLNPVNEMPENSSTNPCLLIASAVGSAGGMFDSSLLTQDDLADNNASSPPGDQGGPTNPATGGWAWPTKISGAVITSCYGSRHGSAGGGYHPGTDIAQQEGTPVYAAQSGKVTFVGPVSGYGNNFVIIEVSPTVHESYGHMDSATVKIGDNVTAGQKIGTVGNQGASTGPHLHFNLSIGTNVDLYNGNASPFQHGLTLPDGVSDPYSCVNYQYPGAA